MQATKRAERAKLIARDFVFVNDDVLGPSYQNGPYVILVGDRSYYAVTYQGKTIDYNLRDFLSAIEACAAHELGAPRTGGTMSNQDFEKGEVTIRGHKIEFQLVKQNGSRQLWHAKSGNHVEWAYSKQAAVGRVVKFIVLQEAQ
jgi:hypothetical protein